MPGTRHVSTLLLIFLSVAAFGCSPGEEAPPPPPPGEDQPTQGDAALTVASFGGAWQDAQRRAMFEPFAASSGVKVVDVEYDGAYEEILLADGVPAEELYPLDLDRAFRSLAAIEDEVVFFARGRVGPLRRGVVARARGRGAPALRRLARRAPLSPGDTGLSGIDRRDRRVHSGQMIWLVPQQSMPQLNSSSPRRGSQMPLPHVWQSAAQVD